MNFKCKDPSADHPQNSEWTGHAVIAGHTLNTAELMIYGRGSCMDTIIGRYQNGLYLCIPDINVGCPLSSMSDLFWNRQRMSEQMNTTDAVTVAYALKAASCLGIFCER